TFKPGVGVHKTGSFVSGMYDTGTGRTRSERTPELEEHVLREFEEQPKMSSQMNPRRKGSQRIDECWEPKAFDPIMRSVSTP
ncbi:hypothetical protein TNIN_219541, partial [Trichonephila inaurata madagascariensis]